MPMLVAPIAGSLSDRIGGGVPIILAGLALQAIAIGWLAAMLSAGRRTPTIVPPFLLAGVGMGLFFAPAANVVLSAVRREEEGKASGRLERHPRGRRRVRRRRAGIGVQRARAGTAPPRPSPTASSRH